MGNNNSASSSPPPKESQEPQRLSRHGGQVSKTEGRVHYKPYQQQFHFEGAVAANRSSGSDNYDDGRKLEFENGNASDLAEALSGQADVREMFGDEVDNNGASSSIRYNNRGNNNYNFPKKLLPPKVYKSSDVKEVGVIGSGEYGTVSKGILQGKGKLEVPVAIKVFNASLENGQTAEHLNAIMNLRNRNVVAILGILESSPGKAGYVPRVILPFYPEGNMLQFLAKPENPVNYVMLLKLALDVVEGCAYLHHKNVIHGNLAARNILIEAQRRHSLTHYNAIVSDHGIIQLAKAKGNGKNYMNVYDRILPVRWVPKELLEENSTGFTFKSDVWSFGILFWEMLSKGAVPYGNKGNNSDVVDLILIGVSPLDIQDPEVKSEETTILLKRIFNVNPKERPSFEQLKTKLTSMIENARSSGASYRDTNQNSEVKKYESENLENDQREREEEGKANKGKSEYQQRNSEAGYHGSRARGRRGGEGRGAGRLPEKSGANNNGSKSGKAVGEDQGKSRQPRSSYERPPENRRGLLFPSGPPIAAFQAMSNPPANNRPPPTAEFPVNQNVQRAMPGMPPPPPPYTPDPLPNHIAYTVGGVAPQMNMNSGGRSNHPPRQNDQSRERDRVNVNFTKEIRKRQQEIEQLKIQHLQQEANKAMEKLHSAVTQLTEMQVPVPQLFPPPVGAGAVGRVEMHHQNNQNFGNSRNNRGGGGTFRGGKPNGNAGGRGGNGRGGRSQSQGRNRDAKLAPT